MKRGRRSRWLVLFLHIRRCCPKLQRARSNVLVSHFPLVSTRPRRKYIHFRRIQHCGWKNENEEPWGEWMRFINKFGISTSLFSISTSPVLRRCRVYALLHSEASSGFLFVATTSNILCTQLYSYARKQLADPRGGGRGPHRDAPHGRHGRPYEANRIPRHFRAFLLLGWAAHPLQAPPQARPWRLFQGKVRPFAETKTRCSVGTHACSDGSFTFRYYLYIHAQYPNHQAQLQHPGDRRAFQEK